MEVQCNMYNKAQCGKCYHRRLHDKSFICTTPCSQDILSKFCKHKCLTKEELEEELIMRKDW